MKRTRERQFGKEIKCEGDACRGAKGKLKVTCSMAHACKPEAYLVAIASPAKLTTAYTPSSAASQSLGATHITPEYTPSLALAAAVSRVSTRTVKPYAASLATSREPTKPVAPELGGMAAWVHGGWHHPPLEACPRPTCDGNHLLLGPSLDAIVGPEQHRSGPLLL